MPEQTPAEDPRKKMTMPVINIFTDYSVDPMEIADKFFGKAVVEDENTGGLVYLDPATRAQVNGSK